MTKEEIQIAIEKLIELERTSHNFEAKEFAFMLLEQTELQEQKESLAIVYRVLGLVYNTLSEFPKSLEYHKKSLSINTEIGNKVGIGGTLVNIGLVYNKLGQYLTALEMFGNALIVLEEIGHKLFQANAYANIGIIYQKLLDLSKAIENYSKALQINEEIGNRIGIAANLSNIGNIYFHLINYSTALDYYSKALQLNKEIEDKYAIAIGYLNHGNVYFKLSDYQNALENYKTSLQINEEIGNIYGIAFNLGSIGLVYLDLKNIEEAHDYFSLSLMNFKEIGYKDGYARTLFSLAKVYSNIDSKFYNTSKTEEYLTESLQIAEEIGLNDLIISIYELLHSIRLSEQNYKDALMYQTKAITLERKFESVEIKNKAQLFDQRRKIEEDERARQLKLARFQEQERIFHNILPIPIANRLIEGEQTIAESFENVSIFFSDIVGFTTLSSRIEPSELVKGLNTIFTAFDRIGTMYGLEKIKTIGDAYMAVCGVPESFLDHTSRTAKFALEINDVLKSLELSEEFSKLQFRIGLHCGSVVAGIIGEKKFAYDVWGDAVNVASRMESNSETGRIHISEVFAKSIESNPEFSIIPRGEINIKGKGTMKTYWLEKGI